MASCKCGRKWTGLAQAHCASGCHEHFSAVANFDKHRRTGACEHPGRLLNRNGEPILKPVSNRFGVTWVGAGEHPRAVTEDEAVA